jgi:hypothetical protein
MAEPAMEDDPSFDRHNPIPGNPRAIRGEIDRVLHLRDDCRAGAARVRRLRPDSWRGHAADEFESFLPRLARPWADAEDEYDRWARALADYHDVLVTAQTLAHDVVRRAGKDGNWARAHAEIERLRAQCRAAAGKAANVVTEAARGLQLLSRPFAAPAQEQLSAQIQPAAVARPPEQRPAPRAADQHRADEPAFDRQSPADLYRKTKSLCDAVLDALFISAEEL